MFRSAIRIRRRFLAGVGAEDLRDIFRAGDLRASRLPGVRAMFHVCRSRFVPAEGAEAVCVTAVCYSFLHEAELRAVCLSLLLFLRNVFPGSFYHLLDFVFVCDLFFRQQNLLRCNIHRCSSVQCHICRIPRLIFIISLRTDHCAVISAK